MPARFEPERLVDRFLHEDLDRRLSPGAQRPAAEAAAESLHAREANPLDLARLAIEHDPTSPGEDLPDLVLLVRLVIVIPQDGDDRRLHPLRDFLHQRRRLFDKTVVGQVAAEKQHVGLLGNLGEERLERPRRGLCAMQVADRRNPHNVDFTRIGGDSSIGPGSLPSRRSFTSYRYRSGDRSPVPSTPKKSGKPRAGIRFAADQGHVFRGCDLVPGFSGPTMGAQEGFDG